MNKIIQWIIGVVAVIALVLSLMGTIGGNNQPVDSLNLGASGTRFPNGISANTTSPVAGELRATNITLSTTNTATSSAKLGCIQTTATSTATPIRLTFNTSFQGTTTPFNATLAGGSVTWAFGTCPL